MDLTGLFQRLISLFQNSDIDVMKQGLGDLLSDPSNITLESLYQRIPKDILDGMVKEVLKEVPGASDNEIVASILSKLV